MKSILKSINLDRLGITASLACALHCAALPLVITFLPLLGLEFLANIWVEVFMISLSLFIGVYALGTSYPKHKKKMPLFLLILGFLCIGTGHFVFEALEAVLVPIGGLIIAAAHWRNWKYSKTCNHQHLI